MRGRSSGKTGPPGTTGFTVVRGGAMIEVLIMNFGGVIVNQHYLHTLLHDVIESYYDPPKCIMSTSIIMSLIMTLIVFQ